MLWLSLTLISALAMTLQDVFSKKIADSTGTMLVAWLRWASSIPFLALCLPIVTIPPLSLGFYVTTGILIPLDVFALVLYMKAIRISPLNVTLPFLSLTPIIMILTGYLFLGETLRPAQIIGILFIAAGAYLINIHTIKDGVLQPILSISKEKGSLLMIVVAVIYGLTGTLGKKAVVLSNPLFFGLFYTALLSIVMTPMVFWFGPSGRVFTGRIRRSIVIIVALGLVGAVNVVTHFFAIRLVEAATMIAVKRTSLLFGVLFGRLVFDEPHFGARFIGAALMAAGVVIVYVL
jgi:drug/metabolite transporter (DMT)-like permease